MKLALSTSKPLLQEGDFMSDQIQGKSLINGKWVTGSEGSVSGFNPATDEALTPEISLLGAEQLDQATAAAKDAFASYRATTPEERAAFLDDVAEQIEARREDIIARATQETGLPEARLTGETSRTSNQLRLFAKVLRHGNDNSVRIDPAQPERQPAPRVDLRQRRVPLGPVAVFGASNFPLAFSTAGGDTASALAAGCPVVFKAHNAHPGTSEIVAQAINQAINNQGLHPGVFNLVFGPGAKIGQRLVSDPEITAVGFTGSRTGGMAIFHAANQRPIPIPVYAEMSAVNPVFVLPGALDDSAALAEGFFGSVTGSAGQLCTKPGLLFLPVGEAGDKFVAELSEHFNNSHGQTMLTKNIADAWLDATQKLRSQSGVRVAGEGTTGEGRNAPAPVVFETDLATFESNDVLEAEMFGPASLVIRYSSADELISVIGGLEGQLTATFRAAESDFQDVEALLPHVEDIAGRILFGGWPTGVEVGHAMVHGGPFPATTNGATTSVGTLAIERFQRPVAYQSFPESLRPAPVQDANPWNVPQVYDGQF